MVFQSPLVGIYEQSGAEFIERSGWRIPWRIGPDEETLVMADEAAVLFDVSHRRHTGYEQPPDELTESLSCNLASLPPDSCTEGLVLRDDATIAAHVDLWRSTLLFVYDRSFSAGAASRALFAVIGPAAADAVGAVVGAVPQPGDVVEVDWQGEAVLAAGNGPVHGQTITMAVPLASGADVATALRSEGIGLGGLSAFDALRTRAGELDWGSERFPPVTPIEADLTHLVDLDARFKGRRSYRRALRAGNRRAIVGFTARSGAPEAGNPMRAGDTHGAVIAASRLPGGPVVGLGWLEPAPVFHRGSKAFGDPLPQLEVLVTGEWRPVSLTDPPFTGDGT